MALMTKTAALKLTLALFLLGGGVHYTLQETARAEAAEAAATAFFSDPGFTQDYEADGAPTWKEVEEDPGADPLQVMLARQAHR